MQEVPEYGIAALFAKHARNSAKVSHFHGVSGFCGPLQDDSMELRRTFMDYGALARKDAALLRKTAHFWNRTKHAHQSAACTVEENRRTFAGFSNAAHLLHSF